MTSLLSLPIVGGSLLAAAAIGVHLGESSVGMIDPIHFQGPAVHPRDRGAAIEEPLLQPPVRRAYGELYGWDEGAAARAAACGDCAARDAPDAFAYSAVVPYFGPSPTRGPAPAQDFEIAEEAYLDAPEKRVVRDAPFERYAYYPVIPEDVPVDEYGKRPSFEEAGDDW